jgi:methionyl-tRNA synthetase
LWSVATHLIGKDILTTHAVYWPTMGSLRGKLLSKTQSVLPALGLPQHKAIVAHGWWVIEGAKISKSRGPKVQPLDLAKIYGADAFRYFLARDAALDRDAEFSQERLEARYQADLANDLGNLLHRVVSMIGRYCDGRISTPGDPTAEEETLRAHCLDAVQAALMQVEELGWARRWQRRWPRWGR